LARIAGVDLPKNERVEIGLTRIFGIGRALSQKILSETKVTPNTRVKDLTDEEIVKIRTIIDRDFRVEGDLRRDISMGIKRLMDINCYRGMRHRSGLPVRGQRTKTNARTRKGPRKVAVSRKKEA
jgi:small subunit ribosomal protein S13